MVEVETCIEGRGDFKLGVIQGISTFLLQLIYSYLLLP